MSGSFLSPDPGGNPGPGIGGPTIVALVIAAAVLAVIWAGLNL